MPFPTSIASRALALLALCAPVPLPSWPHAEPRGQGEPVDEPGGQNPAQPLAQYPGAPYEDSRGDYWIPTVTRGLIHFDGERFTSLTMEDGLPSNMIRDILEVEPGVLWVGTTGGVSVFEDGTFTTLTNYGDLEVRPGWEPYGSHRDIWDIHEAGDGTLWITTMDGVFRYDGETFRAFPLPVVGSREKSEFDPKMVYGISEDATGALWFATDGAGAVRFDGKDMTVFTAETHSLASDRVCVILHDRRGDTWFGTSDGGVSRYDGERFTTHLRSETFSKHTGWGRYMAIHEDRDGNVWFGASMQGGGVHRFDGEAFRYFSTADGLGTGGVPSIRETRDGQLWFGTTAGVFRLEGERFVHFGRREAASESVR